MSQPVKIIRSGPQFYAEWIEFLHARKGELGLANLTVDRLTGRSDGWCDKVIGPSRAKALSLNQLGEYLAVFGIEVHLYVDMDQIKRMEHRWEKRQGNYRNREYRFIPARLSNEVLDRAKPMILGALSKSGASKGGKARAAKLSERRRKQIARKAIKTRWKRHRERQAAEAAKNCQAHHSPNDDERKRCGAMISQVSAEGVLLPKSKLIINHTIHSEHVQCERGP